MDTEMIRTIPAIDMHCHYGEWKVTPDNFERQNGFSESLNQYLTNCWHANIALSVVSHLGTLFPVAAGGSMKYNQACIDEINNEPHVLMLATLNPLWEGSYINVRELFKNDKCFGIKIHPAVHGYHIKDYGEEIYRFASEIGAPIVTHTGEEGCMPADFVPFANRYPDVITDLSHMGHSTSGEFMLQIRAVQNAKHANLYTDTSSRAMLGIDRLERAIFELGYDHVFFGTDAGVYFSPSQRARVDCAHISDAAKEAILYRNALRAFPKLAAIYENAIKIPYVCS